MKYYYVNMNEQFNGDHEVHTSDFRCLPKPENRISLGYFSNCRGAVTEAKKYYRQCNGCYYSSRECHVS